ncbi:hypothetical protein G4O51_09615 [Candidatus Bathyarchaeota archaeon A05DMB-2]|jgi:hypothetical protein|nr:hypothetical protein [Candidatus Bathyarchaeota archaeon A05DMB-2]
MTTDSRNRLRTKLIHLIRQIAREEAWQALDEHLSDYVHEEKTVEEVDVQCEE